MKYATQFLFFSILLAFPIGCGQGQHESNLGEQTKVRGIINGTITGQYPTVGGVVSGSSVGCTATLIDKEFLISANHCFLPNKEYSFRTNDNLSGYLLTPGSAWGPCMDANGIDIPDCYAIDMVTGSNDVAIAHIEKPLGQYSEISDSVPNIGTVLTTVGYGYSNYNQTLSTLLGRGVKREGDLSVSALDAFSPFFGIGGFVKMVPNSNTTPSDGDSGGPLLNNSDEISGTLSSGTDVFSTNPSDWAGTYAMYEPTANFLPWISNTVVQGKGKMLVQPTNGPDIVFSYISQSNLNATINANLTFTADMSLRLLQSGGMSVVWTLYDDTRILLQQTQTLQPALQMQNSITFNLTKSWKYLQARSVLRVDAQLRWTNIKDPTYTTLFRDSYEGNIVLPPEP